MVLRGFTTIWSLATLPTSRSPLSLTATTLGRISAPLSLGTIRATLLRTYATQVLVVPRSIPSRMGLSGAMELTGCYGAARPGGKKTVFFTGTSGPGHAVAHHRLERGRFDHFRRGHRTRGARGFESEQQRPAQDVEGGLGRVGPVETRQDGPAFPLPIPGEADPARDQREEPVEVREDRFRRLAEELEGDAQHRLQQRPPERARHGEP